MAYKFSIGSQTIADLTGSADSDGDTVIDFEEDALHFITNGTERFKISGSNGAITFNGAFTFPVTDGSNNQILKTNGSGQLSWSNESAGGGGGGNDLSVTSQKTVNYTASNWDFVLVNLVGASNDVTITLPAASSDAQVAVKIAGAANGKIVTVDGNGAETVDGAATKTMDSDYESMHLISDGSNWWRIS
jgi:hypothetical protein